MGRPKGGTNRKYSFEEKLRIVKLSVDDHLSYREIQKQEGINSGTFRKWIVNYLESGEEGLIIKKKTGNKFSALHTSKSLSVIERLELENMKLKIENERLKKGYQVKGAGANKVFVTTKEKNTK